MLIIFSCALAWAKFQKFLNIKPYGQALVKGPYGSLEPKFEVAEAARTRPRGPTNFGLTVMEAENSRSPKVFDIGVYGLGLTP